MFSFTQLKAYIEAKKLVIHIYALLRIFPKEEQYALCDQLRRAAVSITSNIAEGSGRNSTKEKIHFLEISYGSLMEVLSQMDIAHDLHYIPKEEYDKIMTEVDTVGKLISGLKNHFSKLLSTSNNTLTSNQGSLTSNQKSLTPNQKSLTPNL